VETTLRVIKRFWRTPLPAFSLLEMSLVLCIMGIVVSFAVPSYLTMQKAARQKATEAKIEALCYALAGYALSEDHLPPAATVNGAAVANKLVGVVPYKTLGLQMSDAKDGYGHWLTYAVSEAATTIKTKQRLRDMSTEQPPRSFCKAPVSRAKTLTIKDLNGAVLAGASDTDYVAFVVVSHGPSGAGAFNVNGQRLPAQAPLKALNADDTLTFVEAPLSPTHDDRIRWVTRNNLMAIFAKAPCEPVAETRY
jgi:type II secretory pathway pseudopilin PulG